mmetsp:Transcript_65694/g.136825  ORF Transcript_65694/g.136825 Transcript_65694/m.136825 type:complete len:162 (-) Transcript_65694:299-784(-)
MIEKMEKTKKSKKSMKKTKTKVLASTISADLDEDDFMNAFTSEPDLHIDYAHSITVGYHNERYYLVFVVGGVNFLWATSSVTKADPELLVRDFLAVTQVKIGKIRVDGAFEVSSSFRAFCERREMELCVATAYNHTMQARIEGAVRMVIEDLKECSWDGTR